jgi:hypothetical protein
LEFVGRCRGAQIQWLTLRWQEPTFEVVWVYGGESMLFFAYLRLVVLCCMGTAALFYVTEALAFEQTPPPDLKGELTEIDEELKKTENLRDKALAAARREEDKGMRWQFMQNEKQEAKRAFERADAKKQEAQVLQQKMDQLNARKAQLLKEHDTISH